jgi:tetratricopeptide (TPR) repeat protein
LFPSDRKMGPLFFKKSHNGWQFDIVSWASWVRFTFNGEAYVMGDDHPYVFAFENTEYSYMLADYDYCDDYSYFSDIQDNYEEHFGKMINQISHDPGDVETRIELGKLYFDLRIVPYATSILLEARELNPDKPIVHLLLGLLMRDFYMLPLKAVDYFKKYIKLRPNDGRGYLYLSKSYWRQAAVDIAYYEKAAKTILRYGEITGDRIYSYERAGYYYYCAKKYREARKYFELVLQMEPANEYVKMKLTEINRRN